MKLRTILALALTTFALIAAPAAHAASPAMPAVGTAVYPLAFHISGQYSASKTGIIKFTAPYTMRVLYTTATIQAKGGTQGTSTITCSNAGNAFTNAMDISVTAGTVVEATLVAAQQSIAKDAAVTCDLVITGGSSPTIDNISVLIWYQRRN